MSLPVMPPLPSYWPIALALLAFGAVGITRGWVREVTTLGGVLLTWLIVFTLGFTILGWVNRAALVAAFTWHGGFDVPDPAALLRTLRGTAPIDPWHPDGLYLVLFLIGAAAAYLVGHRMAGQVHSTGEALLGGLVGAVNGYVLSYVALGYGHAVLREPTGGLQSILSSLGTTLVLAVVLAAVAFALLASGRIGAMKGKRAGRADA